MNAADSDRSEELEARLGNLPVPMTELLGRERSLEQLRGLLWGTRLLTLAGPGGAGKSRLAVALGEAVRADFIGGAWWAELAASIEDGLVPQAVAAAILPGAAAGDATAALVRELTVPALLVLDNCEQVVAGSAALTVALLARCPGLRVIATSRQPLGVPGEQVWRVEGLATAAGGEPTESGRHREPDGPAVELFCRRAREASAAFDPDQPGTRRSVAEICNWLDGIPLAIELAAARTPVLSVAQIAERLRRDADLLRQPGRAAPDRHRTLQDTLEWSHQLLADDERRLFERLGVFRGSFSLAAAEGVCSDEGLPVADVLDVLSRLIDRSLVQVVDSPGVPRYRLLATVRQFAAAHLAANGQLETVRRRHAATFHQLSQAARSGLSGDDQVRWLEELELEHDNLSEAMSWLLGSAPAEAAAMASGLWPFLYQHGYYTEARAWFERAAGDPALDRAGRLDALLHAGQVAFLLCDYRAAIAHLEGALQLEPDRAGRAGAYQRLGAIAREQARYEEARRWHEQSRELFVELSDPAGVASSESYLCFLAWLSGDFAEAERVGGRALGQLRQAGDRYEVAALLVNLGATAAYDGDTELARTRLDEALALSRRLGYQEAIAWALHELAIIGRRQRRDPAELELMLRDALQTQQQLGDRWRVASVLEELAGSVLPRRDPEAAVRLLAAAAALRERIGTPVPPAEADDLEAAETRLRRRLPVGAFRTEWTAGSQLGVDEAVDLAVAAIGATPADEAGGARLAPILTPRELAVLELLSQGHTNREIAATLYVSPSTAGVHVSNILRKLGAKRRVDAAGRAHALGLLPTGQPG